MPGSCLTRFTKIKSHLCILYIWRRAVDEMKQHVPQTVLNCDAQVLRHKVSHSPLTSQSNSKSSGVTLNFYAYAFVQFPRTEYLIWFLLWERCIDWIWNWLRNLVEPYWFVCGDARPRLHSPLFALAMLPRPNSAISTTKLDGIPFLSLSLSLCTKMDPEKISRLSELSRGLHARHNSSSSILPKFSVSLPRTRVLHGLLIPSLTLTGEDFPTPLPHLE